MIAILRNLLFPDHADQFPFSFNFYQYRVTFISDKYLLSEIPYPYSTFIEFSSEGRRGFQLLSVNFAMKRNCLDGRKNFILLEGFGFYVMKVENGNHCLMKVEND